MLSQELSSCLEHGFYFMIWVLLFVLTYTGCCQALASPEAPTDGTLALTEENVEAVLDEVRPYLMSDGGNVELVEIDGLVVKLKLKGACGSCPSSMTTMKMGIERKLMEKIPEIVGIEQIADEETGLELTEENVEKVKKKPSNFFV
jgi:Fe-S cluster biogenesis protein NfuA